MTAIRYVSGPEGRELLRKAGVLISKGPYYEALNNGTIPSIRVGNRFFVPENVVEVMAEKE